jgi:hypothetical protein
VTWDMACSGLTHINNVDPETPVVGGRCMWQVYNRGTQYLVLQADTVGRPDGHIGPHVLILILVRECWLDWVVGECAKATGLNHRTAEVYAWCVVCGVWCVVCGVWCVVCGVWCVVCLHTSLNKVVLSTLVQCTAEPVPLVHPLVRKRFHPQFHPQFFL